MNKKGLLKNPESSEMTMIEVSKMTAKKIKFLGKYGETYEQILQNILVVYEKVNK